MKLLSLSSFFFLLIFVSSSSFAQTLTFAQLTGNPVNTAGWNLTGSAIVNGGEVILTPNQIDQSGTVYYNDPVNLGLCPEAASSLLVPQMMGHHRAAEALLLGEPFMAEAALEVGLVNRVLPPLEANNYAQAIAKKLAAKPISSLVETKRLMKKGLATTVKAQMSEEGASFGRMLREPAAKEAFGAFLEKRRPDFTQM